MKQHLHELYRAAIEADERFSAALQKRFGRNAGDARYGPLPTEIEPLAQEFKLAIDAWQTAYLAACRENR